jgi:hypothetical protein
MMDEESNLLTEAQAAKILTLAPRTLAGWRRRKCGPRYVALARNAIRYYPDDLLAFIEARTIEGIGSGCRLRSEIQPSEATMKPPP